MLKDDDRVFYSDNAEGGTERASLFSRICEELGLCPIFYVGAGFTAAPSNVARELRSDLRSAKVGFVYLGRIHPVSTAG